MGLPAPLKNLNNMFTQATVYETDGERVLVRGAVGLVQAMRAASCLLAPQPHDTVLLALLQDGSAWIVAVLRTQQGQGQLALPKETELATQSLRIRADHFVLEGEEISCTGRLLSLGGHILVQSFSAMQTIARSLGAYIDRVVRRLGSVDEEIAGPRKTRALRAQDTIAASYRLRAENADIRAKDQVDIDANHIKIG